MTFPANYANIDTYVFVTVQPRAKELLFAARDAAWDFLVQAGVLEYFVKYEGG